jgi:hypothetical protein
MLQRARERVSVERRALERLSGADEVPTTEARHHAAERILRPVFDYPQQLSMLESVRTNRRTAIHKNRRAGATDGLGRFGLGMAIAHDNYVVAVVVESLASYTRNWLERPGENALSLLDECGLLEWAHIQRTNDAIKAISFPWGSRIEVLDVASVRQMNRKRGRAAHLWIIEEAQAIPRLDDVLKKLVGATAADFDGHVVLNGTPDPDIEGYFGRAVLHGKGWNVARMASWHNPRFGATDAERWATLCERQIVDARDDYALSEAEFAKLRALTPANLNEVMASGELPEALAWVDELDEDLQREILGRWVPDFGRLVFAWRKARYWSETLHETLEDAVAALRATVGSLDWRAVLAHDAGYNPDPAAWTVTVWAPQHSCAYELWSQTEWKLDDDEQLDVCVELLERCRAVGIRPHAAVADLDVRSPATAKQWDNTLHRRLSIPLKRPNKAHELQQIRAVNLDIRAQRLKFVKGSPLDFEGRHLRWHQDHVGVTDKTRRIRLASGREVVPGDHCLDCLRYSLPFLQVLGQATRVRRERDPDVEQLRAGARARENSNRKR